MRTDILIVGDSWASAVVSGEGDPNDNGWPLLLGIPRELRQAVAGSTAVQWSCNFDGRLDMAVNTSADIVIISLLGNDARAAIADGNITIDEIGSSLVHFNRAVSIFQRQRKKTIVLLYCDPYIGKDRRSRIGVPLINTAIRISAPVGVEFFETENCLKPQHFNGIDFHPNRIGHEAIAKALSNMTT